MARALELARMADYRTSPNPMVGAVVLDATGELAGEGFHRRKGQPHAEQEALAAAGAQAFGGTIYTNLEPCTHAHRTPSCADAIPGPQLTTRDAGADSRQPIRIVLDSHLRTPRKARVLGEGTLLASTVGGEIEGAEVLTLPSDGGRVGLESLLVELGRRDVISVLVEGGSETLASFLDQGLINKLYAYISPKLIGGREAPGPFGGAGVASLANALRLVETEFVMLFEDGLICGDPK